MNRFINFLIYTVKEGPRFGSVRISVRLPKYHPSFFNAISLKRFVQCHQKWQRFIIDPVATDSL